MLLCGTHCGMVRYVCTFYVHITKTIVQKRCGSQFNERHPIGVNIPFFFPKICFKSKSNSIQTHNYVVFHQIFTSDSLGVGWIGYFGSFSYRGKRNINVGSTLYCTMGIIMKTTMV